MGKKIDICKLTGKVGSFVNCHILPKALTYSNAQYRDGSEARFIEIGTDTELKSAKRPKLAHSSWSDKNLVTQEGEDILSRLDSKGIGILRKYRLVDEHDFAGAARSLDLPIQECLDLKLFLLSVLWRSAASDRKEFAIIRLLPDDLELLRRTIVGEIVLAKSDFPISITQYVNLDDRINTSPTERESVVKEPGTGMQMAARVFQIYLMGLSVEFSITRINPILFEGWGNRALGSSDQLCINLLDYQDTFKLIIAERKKLTESQWYTEVKRLVKV